MDFDYMGNAYMKCDNDSSMGRSVLGGGSCFKGKATKEVTVDHGGGSFSIETLHLCSSCAIKVSKDARRRGYKVTMKAIKFPKNEW